MIDPKELVSYTKSNIEGFHFLRNRSKDYRKIYINTDKNMLKGTYLHNEFKHLITYGSGSIADTDTTNTEE